MCAPGSEQPCYSGPSGTQGIGLCKAGTQACLEDGSGFGACTGEVLTGVFDGTVDFGGGALTGAGSVDVFVAKFAP